MNRLRSNDPCWCGSRRKLKHCHGNHHSRAPVRPGSVSAARHVPPHIERPDYVNGSRPSAPGLQIFSDPDDLRRLRHASRIAALVLAETAASVAPGVTTDDLDRIAHDCYVHHGAYPSTLGYGSYSKSICTSVNEVICHGIPDDRPLVLGDIVNIDVTAYIDGFHGDTSATIFVGNVDESTAALVRTTQEALHVGIGAVRAGRPVRDIGSAIQRFAQSHGYGVVADYGGHGIGRIFHAPPHIHHVSDRSSTTEMVPGMVFTVEPMLTAGRTQHRLWDDEWTVVAADGLPSAQFEHTILVTADQPEILTISPLNE